MPPMPTTERKEQARISAREAIDIVIAECSVNRHATPEERSIFDRAVTAIDAYAAACVAAALQPREPDPELVKGEEYLSNIVAWQYGAANANAAIAIQHELTRLRAEVARLKAELAEARVSEKARLKALAMAVTADVPLVECAKGK
jgi:hypothetical protein